MRTASLSALLVIGATLGAAAQPSPVPTGPGMQMPLGPRGDCGLSTGRDDIGREIGSDGPRGLRETRRGVGCQILGSPGTSGTADQSRNDAAIATETGAAAAAVAR